MVRAALLLPWIPFAGGAVEVTVTPQLNGLLQYDDNKLLRTVELASVWQGAVTVGATIEAHDPVTDVTLRPRVSIRRFTEEPDLDSEDMELPIEATRRFERSQLGLTGTFSRRPLYETDLTDTGRNITGRSRDDISVTPTWIWFATERNRAQFFAGYAEASFEKATRRELSDYRYWSAGTTLTHQASEQTQLSLGSFWTRFEPEGGQNLATTIGGRLGMSTAFSETLSASASVGYTVSDLKFQALQFALGPGGQIIPMLVDEQATEGGWIFDASVSKHFTRVQLDASITRRLSPAAEGVQSELQTLTGTVSYRVRQHWTLHANVEYVDRTTQGGLRRNLDRNLLTTGVNLVWRFDRRLNLQAGYRYRRLESSIFGTVPESNAVIFTVRYELGTPLRLY